jgi:hypothetical protein
MSKLIERIEREAGVPGLVSILAEQLSPTDLQSLLLEVYRAQAAKRSPTDVLLDYESDRFVQPSPVSQKRFLEWEETAYSNLPEDFAAIEISPLCPLGTNSVVASVDQNWAVSTSRNNEVVSDSTNVLALECALRRRELLRADPKSSVAVHLATSHRLVRAQQFTGPLHSSHFATFALCSAGRDRGNFGFELYAIAMQIKFWLKTLRAFLGEAVPLIVTFTGFNHRMRDKQAQELFLKPFREQFERVECRINNERSQGRNYYIDFAYQLHAVESSARVLELIDGGCVDWTQQYLSNAKERLVISGLGAERLCQEFMSSDAA